VLLVGDHILVEVHNQVVLAVVDIVVVVVDKVVVLQNYQYLGLSLLSQNHRSPNCLDGYKCFLNPYNSVNILR
jgi:hypothetical protein